MAENSRIAVTLDRMTPEVSAEVRRNLLVWLGVTVVAVTAFCVLFAWLADPDFTGVGATVGVAMMGGLLTLLVVVAGLLITLAYLFDCWPAFLRRRVLAERFGVAAGDVSGAARNRLLGEVGLWVSVGRGAVVGWAFAATGLLLGWVVSGKWVFVGPSFLLVFFGANTAAQAWVVRRAVQHAAAPRLDAEPDAAADSD
jgi:hypothetical protein